jgi:hypothetical protein
MNHWRNTSDSLSEGTAKLRGYRSRYQAFVQEKAQKPAAKIHHQIEKMSHIGQGVEKLSHVGQSLMNVAIFIGLFVAILTLFGFGLSQLKPGQAQQSETRLEADAPAPAPARPADLSTAKPNKRAHK